MKKTGRENMSISPQPEVGPKTHPADREWLPDDPMDMHAVELPGDPEIMLALVVEEYLRLGFDADAIVALARDSNYRAFHDLHVIFGEQGFRRRVGDGGVAEFRWRLARSDSVGVAERDSC